MEKIVIVGGGGHAKSVINVIKKTRRFSVLGYVDPQDRGKILGAAYLGTDDQLPEIIRQNPKSAAAIGVGFVSMDHPRREIYDRLKSLGYHLPAIVSPTAIINEEVVIGEGTVIHDGVIINSDTMIGHGVIINNGSTVDHDCRIGDFVHIAPGVNISGGVEIGDNTLLGIGSKVIHSVRIGENVIVGAGAVVTEDSMCPGTYVGIPATARVVNSVGSKGT